MEKGEREKEKRKKRGQREGKMKMTKWSSEIVIEQTSNRKVMKECDKNEGNSGKWLMKR